MPRHPSLIRRRPTRTQSRRAISSLCFTFIAFIAIICLCPVAIKAEGSPSNSEYGTVIGIGEHNSGLVFKSHTYRSVTLDVYRSGHYVRLCLPISRLFVESSVHYRHLVIRVLRMYIPLIRSFS